MPVGDSMKKDTGKLRFDLLPVEPLEELAFVYTIGARKYEDWGWKKGTEWSRIFAAMLRHLYAWRKGLRYDQEDRQEHLAAVIWCAMTLMEYERLGLGDDDRPCSKDVSPEYVAGLIDGEGWISALETKRGIVPAVGVNMTRREAIERVASVYGGSMSLSSMRNPKWKPLYMWRCPPSRLGVLLTDILPFLSIKRDQALLALELHATLMPRRSARVHGVPEDVLAERKRIVKTLHELNRRGRRSPAPARDASTGEDI